MLDFKIESFDQIASTNAYMLERLDEDEGFVVQALTQTSGKGRHGRIWESPRGNLYLSILLKPDSGVQHVGQIALMLGLAVAQSAEEYVGDTQVKWPNDVLAAGQKLAGILIEASGDALICGIGVNVQSASKGRAYLGEEVDINTYRDDLLGHVSNLYGQWQEEGFEPIRRSWLEKAWNLGKTITVIQQNQEIKGIFKDVDNEGRLILTLENSETHKIQTGDVFI